VNRLRPLPASAAELEDEALFHRFSERNVGLLQRLQNVPEVIINGEGSIHDLTPTATALLYLAWICKRRLGKRTSIINHSCFPRTGHAPDRRADELYARVYGALDHVVVREDRSAAELARLGIQATQGFDCLPLFINRHAAAGMPERERRVVICGSVAQDASLVELLLAVATRVIDLGYSVDVLAGASAFIAQDDLRLVGALHPRLRGRYRFVAATSERQWLDTIAAASLLVSGRFHHSIAAASLGTPFVVAASNTLKIDGLIERLGLQREAIWISPADGTGAISRIESLLADPQPALVPAERLTSLREMALRNFDGVAPPRGGGAA
jgi:polysaccharide pyruvyl transferase WcaK-like protein